ncbi:MAG: hypothetical protein NE328_14570, partial [Lentisphaeraceae bacterium]|nr:hypothetical protein [Lentisphaeraceae bacterium]
GLIDTGSKDLTLTTQASGAGIFDGNVGAVNIIASSLTVNTSGGNFGTSADPIEFFDPNMPITLNLGGGSSFNLSTQQNNTFVDSSSLSTNIGTMPLTLSSTSSNSSGLELLSDNSPTEGTSLPEALNQGDSSLSSGNFVSTGTLSGDYFSSTDLISLNASFDNFLTTQTEITSAEALVNFLENSTDSSNQQSLNILQRMALSIKAIKNNGVSQDQIDSMAANAAAEFSKDEKKKKLFKQALLVLSEK